MNVRKPEPKRRGWMKTTRESWNGKNDGKKESFEPTLSLLHCISKNIFSFNVHNLSFWQEISRIQTKMHSHKHLKWQKAAATVTVSQPASEMSILPTVTCWKYTKTPIPVATATHIHICIWLLQSRCFRLQRSCCRI